MEYAKVEPESRLAREVEGLSGVDLSHCMQCGKCTAGCPLASWMEHGPSQLIRLLQLGLDEEVVNSNTHWLCVSCYTCDTRCPREIKITAILNALTDISLKEKHKPGEEDIALMDEIFLRVIREHGRIYEPELIAEFNLLSGHPFRDLSKGPHMFIKNKLKLIPEETARKDVKKIFNKTKRK